MSTVHLTVKDNVLPDDFKLEVGTGTGGVKLSVIGPYGLTAKFWLNRENAQAVGALISGLAEKGGS